MVTQPPSKRVKTLEDDPKCFSGNSSLGGQMVTIGSKGYIKKTEYIRVITAALYSLGFNKAGSLLEEESRIELHSPIAQLFLKQVKAGEWEESIATLEGTELNDEKAVKLLLLKQKFFEFLKKQNVSAALEILREKMEPLDVHKKRVHQLATKLMVKMELSSEDTESVNSWSKIEEKLQDLLPPAFIIPERRLECLIEKALDLQLSLCPYHNVLDSDLSLCSNHHCVNRKIPSESVQTLKEHTDEVWFVKFSHSGEYLASSSKDKSAIIWEMDEERKFSQKHKLVGHEKPVVMVLWSPDDKQVITCGEEEAIRRWDAGSGDCLQVYQRNDVGSVSCGWFHDGKGIIGAMADRHIYLWNLDGSEIQHEQGQREQKLSDVAMTTDGKWLVSKGRVREISLFDRETRVGILITEEDIITSFSLSKDSKFLLINLITQKMCIWNIEDNPYKFWELTGHKRSRFIIKSCFGGYHDSFVASGSEDSQVYIWSRRIIGRKPCRVLQGHSGAVNCVSWNPTDLHMLASASDDRTIHIWGLDQKLK